MPSSVARTLKPRKSGIIGMIVHTLRYQVGAQTVTGINEVCNRYGYGAMVCCSENDPAKELQAIQLCLNQQVEGFVIVPVVESIEPYQAICEKGTPVVLCTRNLPGGLTAAFMFGMNETETIAMVGRTETAGAGGNRRIAPLANRNGKRRYLQSIRTRFSWCFESLNIARCVFRMIWVCAATMRWAGRSWSIQEFPRFTSRCVKWAFRQGKRSPIEALQMER